MTSPSRDINDLFDDIVLTEEKEARLGYEEGLKDGQEQGNEEGYKLGYAQGVSLGEELGKILGQVVAQQQLKHTDKVRRSLEQLRSLIEEFPRTNDPQADIVGAVQDIRSSPFPTKGAVKPLSPSPSTPLKMPPPPPPTEDPRSELMAAIRNAGGVHGGRLRSQAAAPLDVVDNTRSKAGSAATGDLMADLHNKLMLRRKGISGSQNPGEATAGNPLMQQLSRVIPPPVQPRKGSQSSDDARSEDDEDGWN